MIADTVIGQSEKSCVTLVGIFRKTIEDEDILKLQATTQLVYKISRETLTAPFGPRVYDTLPTQPFYKCAL